MTVTLKEKTTYACHDGEDTLTDAAEGKLYRVDEETQLDIDDPDSDPSDYVNEKGDLLHKTYPNGAEWPEPEYVRNVKGDLLLKTYPNGAEWPEYVRNEKGDLLYEIYPYGAKWREFVKNHR